MPSAERPGTTASERLSDHHIRNVAIETAARVFPGDSDLQCILTDTQEHRFREIYSRLRRYPQEQQAQFFRQVFGEGGLNLPNGEKFGEFLTRVNNIRWFKPQQRPNGNQLLDLVDRYYVAKDQRPQPVRIIRGPWVSTWEDARRARPGIGDEIGKVRKFELLDTRAAERNIVLEATNDAVRGPSKKASEGSAESFSLRALLMGKDGLLAWQAGGKAADGAVHESMATAASILYEDMLPELGFQHGYPESFNIPIYELGYWPIGPVSYRSNGHSPRGHTREDFVIFIP